MTMVRSCLICCYWKFCRLTPKPEEFVIKTVYRTLDKTFEGQIGGYVTLVKDQALTIDPDDVAGDADGTTTLAAAQSTDSIDLDEEIPNTILSQSIDPSDTTLAFASGEATQFPSTEAGSGEATTTAGPVQPSSTSDGSSDEGGGTSAGVKAGIAFGVLGGVLIVALIVFFIFSRRKNKSKGSSPENGSEKFDTASSASQAIPMQSNNRAPRLSLRPVTQFFPANGGDKPASKSQPIGLSLGASAASPRLPSPQFQRPRTPNSPNPFDRPATSQSMHSVNPFGAAAERPVSPISAETSMYSRRSPSPVSKYSRRSPSPVSTRSVAGAVTTNTATRQTSMHADIQDMDFTIPPPSRGAPSPTGTEFSMSSIAPGTNAPPSNGAAAIAAMGGPRNTAVHRVQLDFKPTLEDEMELKAGELVRLLHEYDDGWALCIRLDRSRQGVVPRTCLSTRPVKPRAGPGGSRSGPPVNPSSPTRPRTANGPGSQPRGPMPGMAM